MSKAPIYLDYAAATPLDSEVEQAMQPYLRDHFYNPSATYLSGTHVRHALDDARARVAHWLGARPSEIIFTAGGTEANNLAIHGIMRQYPEAQILVSSVEHESVLAPAHGYSCQEIVVDAEGRINLEDIQKQITDNTVLISVMYANNEVGTIQPIKELARLVAEVRGQRRKNGIELPLYVHSDACQAANYLDLHAARLGVDLMTLNGGKIYGPKQSGVLYIKAGIELMPLISGGGQERGLRSGTENVAGAVGMAAALDKAQTKRSEESARLQKLRDELIAGIQTAFPDCTVNGSRKKRLPNNVHVTFPGVDNERLLIQLDEAGIMAAAGSACSASNEESSHVLLAMGKTDDEARASVRMTLGRNITSEEVKSVISTLVTALPT